MPRKATAEPEHFIVECAKDAKYCVDDLELILSILVRDQKLEVQDVITVGQARYYMSIRPDGKIPPVMRQQVVRISEKYAKRALPKARNAA